jgi:hypothetical protein
MSACEATGSVLLKEGPVPTRRAGAPTSVVGVNARYAVAVPLWIAQTNSVAVSRRRKGAGYTVRAIVEPVANVPVAVKPKTAEVKGVPTVPVAKGDVGVEASATSKVDALVKLIKIAVATVAPTTTF